MKKGKAITLLSIICAILAFVLVMTFLRFPIGLYDYNSVIGAIETDYDISGGTSYTLTLADDNDEDVKDVNKVIEVLRSRLNTLGYSSYSITALKAVKDGVEDYDIRIDLKTTDSVADDVKAITAYGEVTAYGGTTANPTEQILDGVNIVADAKYEGAYEDQHQVSITFTQEAYDGIIAGINAASENSESYYLSLKLGEEELISGSSAITKENFTGKTLYMSTSSEAGAKQFVLQMKTGGLAYKYELSSQNTITPMFGENTGLMMVITVSALILLACIFFFIRFKGFGLVASLTTISFILIETIMMIAVPGIKMSVLGVVGIILSTVITIYGVYLTSKRITEEGNSGKTVKASVKTGFRRSIFPILNSNVVAGIIALMFFCFLGEWVRCFSITFGIGVVVSFLSTMVLMRMFSALVLPITGHKESFFNFKKEEE